MGPTCTLQSWYTQKNPTLVFYSYLSLLVPVRICEAREERQLIGVQETVSLSKFVSNTLLMSNNGGTWHTEFNMDFSF